MPTDPETTTPAGLTPEREQQIRELGHDEFRSITIMDNAVDDLLAEIDRLRAPAAPNLDQQRAQLIEAMSGVSEERWCAGWMVDLERRLHEEGGMWETIGRAIGWPVGNYEAWTWVTWEQAASHFAERSA